MTHYEEDREFLDVIGNNEGVLRLYEDIGFDFAVVDEVGFGLGYNANFGEVAVKVGIFGTNQKTTTVTETHKNPPALIAHNISLHAVNSIHDMGAIYNAQMMDLHAKIWIQGAVNALDFENCHLVGEVHGLPYGRLSSVALLSLIGYEDDQVYSEGMLELYNFLIESLGEEVNVRQEIDLTTEKTFNCKNGLCIGLEQNSINAKGLSLNSCILGSMFSVTFTNIQDVDCNDSYIIAKDIYFEDVGAVNALDFENCHLVGEVHGLPG